VKRTNQPKPDTRQMTLPCMGKVSVRGNAHCHELTNTGSLRDQVAAALKALAEEEQWPDEDSGDGERDRGSSGAERS